MSIQKAVFAVLVFTALSHDVHHYAYLPHQISPKLDDKRRKYGHKFILLPYIKTPFLLLIFTKLAITQ